MKKLFLTLLFLLYAPALGLAAIGSEGSVGTCTSAAAGTTCVVTLGNALEANNRVALVRIAADNVSASDGSTDLVSNVVDSSANTYSKLCEYTYAEGGAGNGATSALWVGRITTQVNISGTVTVTFASSIVAKAVQIQELTVTTGNTLQLAGTCKTENINTLDAGNMTTDTLPSKEYIFVRSIALEARLDSITTLTTNYTNLTAAASDGGSIAASMTIMGERRILTGTVDSSNPTLSSAARDGASLYVALEECTPKVNCTGDVTAKPRPPIIVQ